MSIAEQTAAQQEAEAVTRPVNFYYPNGCSHQRQQANSGRVYASDGTLDVEPRLLLPCAHWQCPEGIPKPRTGGGGMRVVFSDGTSAVYCREFNQQGPSLWRWRIARVDEEGQPSTTDAFEVALP